MARARDAQTELPSAPTRPTLDILVNSVTGRTVTDGSNRALLATAAHGLQGSRRPFPAGPLSDESWQAFLSAVRRQRLSG
ncbi:MAG: hypothetical protein ACRDTJ_23720, partial [Pseudonocardiaceae bacterium]